MLLKSLVCIAFSLLMSGCFTGVEHTGRISDRDVERVKADRKSEEELFLDSVAPADFKDWHPGKRFFVSDDNIRLILSPSSDYDVSSLRLKGDTLEYAGYKFYREIDNTENVVMSFSDGRNTYYYNTGKMIDEVEASKSEYVVPFLIDLDFVARIDRMLAGKTLFVKTPVWLDEKNQPQAGRRYVPVTVCRVVPGDVVYPMLVKFSYEGKESGVYMSSYSSSVRNMSFDRLFSFSDIRNRYKSVSDSVWSKIVHGRVAENMTKEECSLSLGAPRSIDRMTSHGGLYERWSYDNGVYLIFENGILVRYRQ